MTTMFRSAAEGGAGCDGCYSAGDYRELIAGIVCGQGVTGPSQFDLTVTGNLTANVAPGRAFVAGTALRGGVLFVSTSTTQSITFAAEPSTSDRIDLVVVSSRFCDDAAIIRVITGTPSANPTPPPTPGGELALYAVRVDAGTDTIEDVTDLRQNYRPCSTQGLVAVVNYRFNDSPAQFVRADWPGIRAIRVRAVAGGGGGGGSGDGPGDSGSGGGGGGYAERFIQATSIAAVVNVTVGQGGAGGGVSPSGSAGSPGTNSLFGGQVGTSGGQGGSSRHNGGLSVHGGEGGTGNVGDLLIAGQAGQPAYGRSSSEGAVGLPWAVGGAGGASHMGLGGQMRAEVTDDSRAGRPGLPYGGGGGGAASADVAPGEPHSGGAGFGGLVQVEVYT